MDFVYLIRVLLHRKWIILGSAVLAALIAWYLTRDEPKYYRSSTRISTGFAVPDEIRVNENFAAYDAEVKFNNTTSTLTSLPVISLLSYELIVHDLTDSKPFHVLTAEDMKSPVYKELNKDKAIVVFKDRLESMNLLTSFNPEEKKLIEVLNLYGYSFKDLSQALTMYQVPRTDYLQIDGVSENPELSAFVVNNVFKQFIRYFRRIRSSKSQESVDTLQSLMDNRKQELDDKNAVLRGEGIVDATTENTSKFDLIASYEKSLTDEKNKQTDDYYTLRKINQKLGNLGSSTPPSSSTANTTDYNSNNNEELVLARKAMNEAYAEYLKTNDKAVLAKYKQLKAEYNSKYANTKPAAADGTPGKDSRRELLDQKNDVEIDIEASNSKIKTIESKIAAFEGKCFFHFYPWSKRRNNDRGG